MYVVTTRIDGIKHFWSLREHWTVDRLNAKLMRRSDADEVARRIRIHNLQLDADDRLEPTVILESQS